MFLFCSQDATKIPDATAPEIFGKKQGQAGGAGAWRAIADLSLLVANLSLIPPLLSRCYRPVSLLFPCTISDRKAPAVQGVRMNSLRRMNPEKIVVTSMPRCGARRRPQRVVHGDRVVLYKARALASPRKD
jgi:hypothetical protein